MTRVSRMFGIVSASFGKFVFRVTVISVICDQRLSQIFKIVDMEGISLAK